MKQPTHLIGIDPGKNTGVCLYRRSDRHFTIDTMEPWLVPGWFDRVFMEIQDVPTVYMEDPRKNKPVFNRFEKLSKRKALLSMQKIAQGVGSNKRDVDWLEYYIQKREMPLYLIRPSSAKWDKKTLKTFTGYTGRTNEHVRDAIKLVYGR